MYVKILKNLKNLWWIKKKKEASNFNCKIEKSKI